MTDEEDTLHMKVVGTALLRQLRDYCLQHDIEAQRASEYLGSVLVQMILLCAPPPISLDEAKNEAIDIINAVKFLEKSN